MKLPCLSELVDQQNGWSFRKRVPGVVLSTVLTLAFLGSLTKAQEQKAATGGGAQDLAKQLANPVASLISVPIQTNYDFGVGPGNEGFRFTTNIQPVVPFVLTPKINLITRNILPIVHQSDVFVPLNEDDGGESGVYPGAGYPDRNR